VSRARLGWIVSLAAACAGPPPLPPGASASPALGDSPEALFAKLPYAGPGGAPIEVTELRVLAVDREPWTRLDPPRDAIPAGRVGVIAGRRCTFWEGVRWRRVERASWFLLRDGALVAFEDDAFGPRCVTRPVFEPTRGDDVPVERMLVRYVSQRWPIDTIASGDHLTRGLRLLALDRPADADAELRALDLQIRDLERRQDDEAVADPAQRAALREQLAELRGQRAQLERAIRDREDPREGELR